MKKPKDFTCKIVISGINARANHSKWLKSFNDKAIKKDPNFVLTYAGLAEIYSLFTKYSVSSQQNTTEQFKARTMKALEHDDSLAKAHNALAFILYKSEWNWLEAENHFRRTIEITPGYALAHHWSGNL